MGINNYFLVILFSLSHLKIAVALPQSSDLGNVSNLFIEEQPHQPNPLDKSILTEFGKNKRNSTFLGPSTMLKLERAVFDLVGELITVNPFENDFKLPSLKNPVFTKNLDVMYGPEPEHTMDIYLPKGKTNSKVIVLVHGGKWEGGKKEDMNNIVALFSFTLPRFAIVNMNYRLGTVIDPGFPKQITDIKTLIAFLKSKADEYSIDTKFAFVGFGTGAHLSLLYGYKMDEMRDLKVICNINGFTDLKDPSYTGIRDFESIFYPLLGAVTYSKNSYVYYQASPVVFVTKRSPKTISFYGGKDEFIPVTQRSHLKNALDNNGVYNEFYFYPKAGHGNFTLGQFTHLFEKMTTFVNEYL